MITLLLLIFLRFPLFKLDFMITVFLLFILLILPQIPNLLLKHHCSKIRLCFLILLLIVRLFLHINHILFQISRVLPFLFLKRFVWPHILNILCVHMIGILQSLVYPHTFHTLFLRNFRWNFRNELIHYRFYFLSLLF